jgi:hypothetical protein
LHEWGNLASEQAGASTDVADGAAVVPNQSAMPGPKCPGCQHLDIAMRSAITSFLKASAKVSDAKAPAHSLCDKHIAEALIYAEDTSARARIAACLGPSKFRE